MKKFICIGTYVKFDNTIGIVKNVYPVTRMAIIETSHGISVRSFNDLIVLSYKGVD